MVPHLLAALVMSAGVEPTSALLPDSNDVRIQKIARMPGEKDWPFVAQSGRIYCLRMWGSEKVYFIPDGEFKHHRAFHLTTNMTQMTLVNYGMNDVLVPMKRASEVVERIRPFVEQGHMLCKYNEGPVVPGSEL